MGDTAPAPPGPASLADGGGRSASAAVATARPASRVKGPFIMPDGRPLTAFLDSQQLRPQTGGGTQRRRPGAIREPKEGWTRALPRAATAAATAGPQSEAEQAELYALSRVGQRKQRRWMNDRLLREMAGMLSAADMAALFSPVPFGQPRVSTWERAAAPEHAVLWDMFRSLDMDRQARVLRKWEAHVRELQAGPSAVASPVADALAAWAGVPWKARAAMKRAPATAEAIEAQLLDFLQEGAGGREELVVEGLEGGFHRLIAHGLVEYHQARLVAHSRAGDGGGKQVVVRRRAAAERGDDGAPPTGASPRHAAARARRRHADDGSEGEEEDEEAGAAAIRPGATAREPAFDIACSDILHVLADDPAPLNASTLRQAYVPPPDSSSDAGDHRPAHEPLHAQRRLATVVEAS